MAVAKLGTWIKGSVSRQLALVLLIPVLLFITTIALLEHNEWSSGIRANVVHEAERNAATIAAGISDNVHEQNLFSLRRQLDRIYANEIRSGNTSLAQLNSIAVIDMDGVLLAHTAPNNHSLETPFTGNLPTGLNVNTDMLGGSTTAISTINEKSALLVSFIPIRNEGNLVAGVISEYNLERLFKKQQEITETFLFRSVVAIVISFLLASLIIRHITNPLTLITKALHRVGKGSISDLQLTTRDDEFKNIISALIQADERIRSTNDQLYDEAEDRQRVVNNLAEREQLLDNILNTIPMAVFIKRADDLSYVRINKSCEKLTGFANEEFVGKSDYDFWPLEIAENYIQEDREVLQQGLMKEIVEEPLHSRDGELHWVHTRKVPVYNDSGKPIFLLGIADDITERKRMEKEIDMTSMVLENSSEAILITDKDNNIISVNNAFEELTGYTRDEVLGNNPRILKSGRHDKDFYQDMWHSILEEGRWQGELWERRKDGTVYPKWLTINAIKNSAGEITNYLSISSDVSERKKAEDHIYYLAHHDTLTGLANRMLLGDRIRQAIHQSRRTGHHAAILFIDLDGFKIINDTLGHDIGDAMLRSVSDRLQGIVRDTDTVARMGGDEFIILLSEITHEEDAARVAEKVVHSIAEPIIVDDQELRTTPSIGISMFPQDGNDEFSLVRTADTAMYHAKADGRNNYQFYTSSMHEHVLERLTLERGLRQSLESDNFDIEYQPQINVLTGELLGFEALVRWQHPQWGTIPPDKFIPIAEESGIINQLGEWILRATCAQAAAWQKANTKDLRISINVSSRQFWTRDFSSNIKTIIADTGVNPKFIELEVTESALSKDQAIKEKELHELRDLGIKIAIDDFGTGYSSLITLKRLAIDRLKIDESFVVGLGRDKESEAIVTAIIKLAETLNIEVIAVGVETEQARDFLLQHGCHVMQGFLFGEAKQAASWIDLIQGNKAASQ